MHIHAIDWIIIAASLLICFVPALFVAKRSGKSTSEFFASGRSVPWWLAGLSMVATTFSSDTPNLVTNIVRTQGVAGNWQWWAFTLTGMATVFFYARLWRRSGVLTDLEFYEIRYSGKPASVVRGFRALYLGFCFNCLILATVELAGVKIANLLFGIPRWETLLGIGLLNVAFASHSGLWGVLVIDMIQFFVKMAAVIAAAYFALKLPEVGGLQGMVQKLSAKTGPHGVSYLNVLPSFSSRDQWDVALTVFVMPIAVQWWSVWYPGAEPGGGSYIAQRMLASKSEKDALGGVLFFNLAHYVLRPWPWILVGLCSIIVYPTLGDIKQAFPQMDAKLLGHDSAYPAMLKFLPPGWLGLMIGGLIAASSSTVLTHLNWGSSYVVHDFYRRFVKRDATERHYVNAGRLMTVVIFLVSGAMVYVMGTAKTAFDIILSVGAGTGLLYLARWFWWRVSAWSEIVAMISSFAVATTFLVLNSQRTSAGIEPFSSDIVLLVNVCITTTLWVATALLGPRTDMPTLVAFYKKVRPAGPGWNRVRAAGQINDTQLRETENDIPMSLLGWVAGCICVWSGLFTVGNFLYGRMLFAMEMLIALLISGGLLIWVVRRLWSDSAAAEAINAQTPPPEQLEAEMLARE